MVSDCQSISCFQTLSRVSAGGEKLVTDANKQEYINAVLTWRYSKGVYKLTEKLTEGITGWVSESRWLLCGPVQQSVARAIPRVVVWLMVLPCAPPRLVAMSDIQKLSSNTLKLLLCGQTVVDVEEWRRTTIYIEGYTESTWR